MSGMTFLLGMLSPRTNVKGMIAGWIGGMIPLTCSLIGMFFIPRHKSFYNSTGTVLTFYLFREIFGSFDQQGLKLWTSKKCGHV